MPNTEIELVDDCPNELIRQAYKTKQINPVPALENISSDKKIFTLYFSIPVATSPFQGFKNAFAKVDKKYWKSLSPDSSENVDKYINQDEA